MQDIEPFYNWRHLYTAEDDPQSPFYGREYSEFEYSQTIYNFYIHPQWDEFGSRTLYMKLLMVDYEHRYAIIELIGEWNDAIENDIMTIRREITDYLFDQGIEKFVLIAENVLNFHSSDESYYEEWYENLQEVGGWAVILDLPSQSQHDFVRSKLHHYLPLVDLPQWRTMKPENIIIAVDEMLSRQLP
jgi:hypothetical protein